MKSRRVSWLVAAFILAVLVAAATMAGRMFYDRARQVRTFADMQIISRKIDSALEASQVITGDVFREIIETVNKGRDSWGNAYSVQAGNEETPYVLVSPGSDHALDVGDIGEYLLEETERDIRGEYDRDIVFVDGVPLTLAGK